MTAEERAVVQLIVNLTVRDLKNATQDLPPEFAIDSLLMVAALIARSNGIPDADFRKQFESCAEMFRTRVPDAVRVNAKGSGEAS
jgi:hypothetical protein